MNDFDLWCIFCFGYLLFSMILVAPIICFGNERARWDDWELLLLIIPFSVWCLFVGFGPLKKGLGNCEELTALLWYTPLALLVRVIVGDIKHKGIVTCCSILTISCILLYNYYTTPFIELEFE